MEPSRTVEFAMRFAAAWSAWWLLPALPIVVLLGVAIYRRQSGAIARGHAWGLTVLRAVILASVVVLAFRPSLVRRNTATYQGRLLMVLDDSASMGVCDPGLPEAEALKIARRAMDCFDGHEAPVADLREDIVALERTLVRFEQFSRSADRSLDGFWDEAERVQGRANELLETVAERATDLANGAGDPVKLNAAAYRCRELQASLTPLFSGNEPPADEFSARMRAALDGLIELLDEVQYSVEQSAVAAGDPTPTRAVESVRGTARRELAYAWLRRHRDELVENLDGLSLWLLPLSQPEAVRFSGMGPDAPAGSAVETDITGVLLRQIEAENPFPLAGIVLFSDGRNLGDTALESVTRAAALRSVPIYSAGVGGLEEPPDIAVREVRHAPFAVAGTRMGVRALMKTVLPKPEKVELELLDAGQNAITNETLEIEEQHDMRRWLAFTPDEEGLQRLTVRAGSVEGEVAPRANNSMDLTVRVRTDPVRVLFLDWKPRWESRFALNILGRLGYLDVNAIVVLARPDGKLERGIGKGYWPENADALGVYDLVIIGDLPSDLLTTAEWQWLVDYVEAGGSLVMLGTGRRDPLPAAVADGLLPTLPREEDAQARTDTATLQLTLAGRHHPVTRSLVGTVQNSESVGADRRRDDTIALLQTSDGRLLISTRFSGKGKTLLVDTDRLWRRLNAAALDAHAGLVAGMADWAVGSGGPEPGLPRPDLYRYTTRESVQVWVGANDATNPVVELRAGERRLEAEAMPAHPGSTWAAAVFETVPAGDWTVKVRGGGVAPEPLLVVDRSRELHDLSRDEPWLRRLASDAGGACAGFVDAGRLLNDVQPRSRVEHRERIWRLWDSGWILGLLIVLLTVEWIWRKLAGLV